MIYFEGTKTLEVVLNPPPKGLARKTVSFFKQLTVQWLGRLVLVL